MTRSRTLPETRRVARVVSFRDDRGLLTEAPLGAFGCRVRVTHASVGSTDVMARRGDYLLHPSPGFVSGYDFVGVLETVNPAARRRGLEHGQRVAGILPRMGAHASSLDVPASLLVPVPEKQATALGFGRTLVRRFADPREVLCSVPMYVGLKRAAYRRDLSAVFHLAARGQLVPPEPELYDLEYIADALQATRQPRAGTKIVLQVGG
jgi:hypothetical protein